MDTSAILWGALTIALTACGWMGAFIFQRSVRLGERADNRIDLTSERQGGVLAELSGIRAEIRGMRADLTRIEDTRASKESVEHIHRDLDDLKSSMQKWGPAFQEHLRSVDERLDRKRAALDEIRAQISRLTPQTSDHRASDLAPLLRQLLSRVEAAA